MAERRPKTRKRVLLTGIIAYGDGAHSFHCTIRNLSESGARLAVANSTLFPTPDINWLSELADQVQDTDYIGGFARSDSQKLSFLFTPDTQRNVKVTFVLD